MGLVLALKTSLMGGVFVFLGLDPFFSFYPFFLFSFLRFCFTFVVVVVVVVGGGGGVGGVLGGLLSFISVSCCQKLSVH